VRLKLPRAPQFDVILLQEDISRGQAVSAHHVDARWNGEWRTVAEGSTIGYKRLHRIPPTAAAEIRVVVEAAVSEPHLAQISLHSSDG
jgi:alpha-L-fucosidase